MPGGAPHFRGQICHRSPHERQVRTQTNLNSTPSSQQLSPDIGALRPACVRFGSLVIPGLREVEHGGGFQVRSRPNLKGELVWPEVDGWPRVCSTP